ncbi:MAG: PLAT/LH2 domain-containing protein [Pseudonocardiaceae bacterium]
MKSRTAQIAVATAAVGLLLAGAPIAAAATGAPALATAGSATAPGDVSPQALRTYTVQLQTGNRNNAGTDADVKIKLVGTLRTSPWVNLDNPGDDRERRQLDTYRNINLDDVGDIKSIRLNFDDSGDHSDWYLDWVKVTPNGGPTYFFEAYRWIKTAGEYTFNPAS